MHQSGIEPPHTAPEAVALSTELRACLPNECNYSTGMQEMQPLFFILCAGSQRTVSSVLLSDGRTLLPESRFPPQLHHS